METKHKTWEECCDEIAKNYGVFNANDKSMGIGTFIFRGKEAAELYNQETAKERDMLKEELAELKKSTFDEAFKTVEEIHSLKAELEKERTTGRQEWERLQLDKIDSLKEELDNTQKELSDIQINLSTAEDQIDSLKGENERIKKELTYFKEGAEYQLGVEHGCDSLKQINSELVEAIIKCEKVFDVYQEYMQGVLEPESELTLQLIKSMIKRAKKTQP